MIYANTNTNANAKISNLPLNIVMNMNLLTYTDQYTLQNCFIWCIAMSSSLSPPLGSPTLPLLLNRSQPTLSSFGISRSSPKAPSLPKTTSYLIVQGLFRRTLLSTSPASVQYSCLQPNCEYTYTYPLIKITSTGNLSTVESGI
jgi:hypothetical protein